MKAVILAAGVGRRLVPITEQIPKCLVEIGGKPLLTRMLAALSEVGVSEVALVVGHLQEAIRERIPFIAISCSGGARMQESVLSLMQMAKTSAALARLGRAGLPYISILTDPTTGGVTASYAMLGDINVAEPNALIGFAGPRVIQDTIRQELPAGFQRAEFLLNHGFVDMIVERKNLRQTLIQLLDFFAGPSGAPAETPRP